MCNECATGYTLNEDNLCSSISCDLGKYYDFDD